jgi:hypothetical protein
MKTQPVTVDPKFVRVGAKSYPINKIDSVEVQYKYPYSKNAFFFWGLVGVICVASMSSVSTGTAVLLLLATVGCAVISYQSWRRSKIKEFMLLLVTASGQSQLLASRDEKYVFDLRDQIEGYI